VQTNSGSTGRDINRIRPLAAFKGLRKLIQDPEDAGHVFEIVTALSGNVADRNYRRYLKTDVGRAVCRERRNLLVALSDRKRLESLPLGTLGRSYAEFMGAEGLEAQSVVLASQRDRKFDAAQDEERRLCMERFRDLHDVWHVVLGYDRSLLGEGSVVAFTAIQMRNLGPAFVAIMGFLRCRGESRHGKWLILNAFARGLRARWFAAADWEALLDRPLDEVRESLRLPVAPAFVEGREGLRRDF